MPRKRNASGAGSIRQRSDGRWEARITVGTDTGTGRPVRRSIYGNTQKEVLVAMRDAQKSVDDGFYIEPTRLTLAQWLDIWQRDYLLSQKYGTVKTYRAQIATHIKPALGAVKLNTGSQDGLRLQHRQVLHPWHSRWKTYAQQLPYGAGDAH